MTFLSGFYLFKVNNRNTRTKWEIYSNLLIKTPVWYVYHWLHIDFKHYSCVSIVDFEEVNNTLILLYISNERALLFKELFRKSSCQSFQIKTFSNQEDFTWQKIWRTSIHLFKVRWNDHLVNDFPLMYRYEINTSTLYIFSCRNLIVSYKMLIITGISNENKWINHIWNIMSKRHNIYRQELACMFQVQEKLKACKNSKLNFSSSCFTANDNHEKIIWLHVVVFSQHDILHIWDNVHLFKYYPVKVP